MDYIQIIKQIKESLDNVRSVCDKLDIIATDAGEIDQDEIDLINVIRKYLEEYDDLLMSVLDDGEITDNELREIKMFEMKITKAVQHQIIADGVISDQEETIVHTLFDCLKSLNSIDSFLVSSK